MGDKHNKNEEGTDRSGGGPGSSHQGGSHGHAQREGRENVKGVNATNDAKSDRSGGGGERDSHHTHDPEKKGDRSGY